MTTPSNQSRLTQEQINSVVTLYSNGDYQEAIDQIKALNASYPNVPFLFNLVGACYKELGRSKGALKMFETALKIKPDYFEAYKNLGITHRDLGQFELAVEKLKSSIAIEPNNVDAHYNLAITYKDINEIDKAIESYKKVMEINPKFAAAYNNLGNIFKESGRKHSAIDYYEKAIEINPKFAEAFNNLGNTYRDIKKREKALICFEQAIDLKPDLEFVLGDILNSKMQLCLWDGLENILDDLINRINKREEVIAPFPLMSLTDDTKLLKKNTEELDC